jgi:hypothetical protein
LKHPDPWDIITKLRLNAWPVRGTGRPTTCSLKEIAMTDPANRDLEATADETAGETVGATAGATAGTQLRGSTRQPYRAPHLRHLGSVRELTLGGTPTAGDVAGGMGNIAMM